MIRNLKILGLALTALFAFSAIASSPASAQTGVWTSGGGVPVTLDMEETTLGSEQIGSFGDTVKCPGSTYTGHKYNVTPHTFISNEATTITVTPHYKQASGNCRTSAGLPVTIFTNGCDYVFHLGETTGGVEGTYGITADIVCPEGKSIEIAFYSGVGELLKLCTEVVTPITGLKGAHATNTSASGITPHDVHVTGTFTGIVVHRSGACVTEDITTENNGTFFINSTVKATDEAGRFVGFTISHK